MTDLLSLKQDFCNIVQKAQPWILSHFIMWLDLKIAEYKVYGYMVLEQGTSLVIEPKDQPRASAVRATQSSDVPSSAGSHETPSQSSSQQVYPRAPCLVVPRPNLSTDRAPASSSTLIPASTTPIFKRPLFGGRANRRKQQHVFRRSSTSLLTALSGDIYNTVGIESGRRDGEERRGEEYGGGGSGSPQESDLSISSSVSQSVTESATYQESNRSDMESDASPSVSQSVSPGHRGAAARIDVEKARRSLNDLFCGSDSEVKKGKRARYSDDGHGQATSGFVEDDMEALSSQYEELNRSKEDCIILEENDNDDSVDPAQEGNLGDDNHCDNHDNEAPETVQRIGSGVESSTRKDTNPDDSQVSKCDTQCSSSQPELSGRNVIGSTTPRSSLSRKYPSVEQQSPSTSTHNDNSSASQAPLRIKQENSVLDSIQIKLEPVDTSPTDLYYHRSGSSDQPSSSRSLLHQHLSYSSGSMASQGYFDGIDWNAVGFNQYLDSSQSFSNGTSPTSTNQDVRSSQRSVNMSPTTPSKSDPSLTCNLCGAVFRFKSSLSRHKTLHGEKRFHCFVCPKAFHRREHLLLHLQRHANSAMIRCPVCHMQASSVKHLEEHYRLNHGPFKRTGVMPYVAGDSR